MDAPHNISQLTLIKTFSTSDKYVVHTQFNGKSLVYELDVDHDTSVHSFIQEALALLRADVVALELSSDRYVLELYAARRSGRKVSDLPSYQGQQKVVKTGQKCFFLLIEQREGSNAAKTSTISTNSIRTEMKPLQIKTRERGVEKQKGCFCFS